MLLIIDDYIELALAVHEVGIKISNVESVWKALPDFICAVSELTEAQDMQNTVYELMAGYSKVR